MVQLQLDEASEGSPSLMNDLRKRSGTDVLHWTVESGLSEGELARALWDDTAMRLKAPVYLSYDWVKTWWEFYGSQRQLRIFRFWRGDEAVALLPLYLEVFGIGPFQTIVARLVGANLPPKAFDPPVDPAWASQVFTCVMQHLFTKDSCDLVSVGPVSADWAPSRGLQAVGTGGAALPLAVSYQPRDVKTLFHLPASFEQYLFSLPAGERGELKRRLRQLGKVGAVSTAVVTEPARATSELESFMKHHGQQWRSVGLGGHFEAWPYGKEFHRQLVPRQGRLGRVQFHQVLVDGRVIANRYCYLWGKSLYSELPSREAGQPWDKLGLGGTAYLKLFEAAIHDGISTVDSGLGHYDNKRALGGEEVKVGVWRVVNRARLSPLKARAFGGVRQVLGLLLHKIWYRRLLPWLPQWAGRSQSRFWLRFDA